MEERLQKIISSAGLMSRRAAEKYIEDGRVTVNGKTAVLGEKADADTDTILVDGKVLSVNNKKIYVMLNKPKGYVTTLKDEKGRKNVTELVKAADTRIYPVGRLDMYSEGLLILTNDGDFANMLMHPSHDFRKVYRTWVQGEDVGVGIEWLRCPIDIDGCVVCAESVDIERAYAGGAVLLISISEGRNRQVRKMCEACGLKVTKLLRISEGPLELGDLRTGEWRFLSEEEISVVTAQKKEPSNG